MSTIGRILVVEDSPPNRMILCHLLQKLGFEVFESIDGQDALDWLNKNAVDLVLSDLMMPRLDGVQLLKQVRSHPQHKEVPFYLVTALEEQKSVREAEALKCNGVLLKPLSLTDLKSHLSKYFPNMKDIKKAG